MKRNRQLVCCKGCGRDTLNPSGYCFRCCGWKVPERERRPAGAEEIEKKTVAEEYNGDTVRDDI